MCVQWSEQRLLLRSVCLRLCGGFGEGFLVEGEPLADFKRFAPILLAQAKL